MPCTIPALADATFALMDIDPRRLEESEVVARKMIAPRWAPATVETTTDRRRALDGADFVVIAFQIGGYRPSTVIDFEIPKKPTACARPSPTRLASAASCAACARSPTSGPWRRTWPSSAPTRSCSSTSTPWRSTPGRSGQRFPQIKQVGLCHSVQGTAEELARDLDLPVENSLPRRRHQPHGLLPQLRGTQPDGPRPLPALCTGLPRRALPEARHWNARCPNKVRYEVMNHLGHFVTEVVRTLRRIHALVHQERPPRPDRHLRHPARRIPKRCEEQIAHWAAQAEQLSHGGPDRRETHPRIRGRRS